MGRGKRKRSAEPSSQRSLKRFRSDFSETIIVLVGSREDKFTIHKKTACDTSPFFQAACSRRWIEGQEGIVRLPDADPKIFEAWTHWAYSKQVRAGNQSGQPEPGEEEEWRQATYRDLCALYALANYLQDRPLRNRIVDRLIQIFEANPNSQMEADVLNYAWSVTAPDSKLRSLLLEVNLARARPRDFHDAETSWPPDFLRHAAMRFFLGLTKSTLDTTFELRELFHEHENGQCDC